jgi:predicted nucleic acid-binding protein
MIVDASVLLSAFFPDEQQPASQMLIRDYVAGQITLVAPSLLGYEIANAVRQAERRERITQEQAESILLAYEGLQIRLQSVEWQQVLLLARHFNHSAYDAAYLALAQATNDTLITGDLRFYNAVSPHRKDVLWVGNYRTPTKESPQ